MDVVSNNYLPGDPRLIDHIVYELKSQGIFDNFRKECIADVDTKPAYQNLRQRVEGSVIGFLKTQRWRPDMNKNHVREMLRKNISESGFLETGVERIVDQVVNPKINSIFLPQVENVVYKVLGIQKPSTFDELKAQTDNIYMDNSDKLDMSGNNLLPSDLETVSPESEPHERKLDLSNESQKLDSSKIDEDESPPFEPLEESTSFIMQEENSVDSHLSGFSGLASHDSNHSFEVTHKITPMEISNQDSQFSKQSSDDRLSIVMSDETETKMEINEDSSQSKLSKTTDSNSKGFDFLQDNHANSDKSSQSLVKQDKIDSSRKAEDKSKGDEKKADKHRSSDKHKPRHDNKSESRDRKSEKDRKSDRDKRDSRDKNKHSSKERKDRDREKKDSKSKSGKDDKDGESKSDKEHKHEKDRDRSRSSSSKQNSRDKNNSKKDSGESKTKEKPKETLESKDLKAKDSEQKETKTKESEYKDSKVKESELKDSRPKDSSAHKEAKIKDGKEKKENSKGRDDSKSKSDTKPYKGDSKSHLKHSDKSKTDSSEADKCSRSNKKDDRPRKKDDKHHSRSEKYSSSNKKDEKRDKDKKDSKKDIKKVIKDDHYSLKVKNSNRRSTDRDSSDGHSGTHSSSSSFADSSSSQIQKSSQDNSRINSSSNSGDSGNSDQVDEMVLSAEMSVVSEIQENVMEDQEQTITAITSISQLPPVKLIKPKFASNIFEARRLMKIRKKLGKIEKQSQMGLINAGVALSTSVAPLLNESDSVVTYEILTVENESDDLDSSENSRRRPNILKKPGKLNSLSPNRDLKLNTAQLLKNKDKASHHHRKSDENETITTKKLETSLGRKVELEEENVGEIVEISDDSVSKPLQNSVISKESWDAVEAKLIENVMKVDYNSYSDSHLTMDSKEISTMQSENAMEITENGDCLYLSSEISAETQRYLVTIRMLISQLEEAVRKKEMLLKMSRTPKQMTAVDVDTMKAFDGINRRLPKVAIVDVTNDREIIISPNKGIKRHASDHPDVHNNNKTRSQLEEDQLAEKLNHAPTKPSVPSKAKKAKTIDNTVHHLDTFNLPLSPAESDKSFTTISEKKFERDDAKVKRNSNISRATNNFCNQRYSTDDLYKPRLQFSSSRRRAAKGRDAN